MKPDGNLGICKGCGQKFTAESDVVVISIALDWEENRSLKIYHRPCILRELQGETEDEEPTLYETFAALGWV